MENQQHPAEPVPDGPAQPQAVATAAAEPARKRIPHKAWTIYFVLLALANVNTLISVIGLLWLSSQAAKGISGTEFVTLLFLPGLHGGILPAFLNIVTIPIFVIRYKKGTRAWIITAGIVILSAAYLAWALPGSIQDLNTKQRDQQSQQQAQSLFESRQQQYNAATKPKEISLADATSMINACQIHQFYDVSDTVPGEDAASSSTGLYLISLPGTGPWRITATTSMGSQLTATVQAAEAKCGGIPYFNNDTQG